MANITLAGTLRDPNGDLAVGDKVRFTHKSTTGETVKSASSILTIDPTGVYSVDLEYGLILVEYKDARNAQFENLGVATVNGTNPATTIPELLNALVPVSSAELIEFQAILADCVAAKDAAEAAAATVDVVKIPVIYETVALFKASMVEYPDGKTVHLNDRKADFIKITGTGTATGYGIIASTLINQSIVIVQRSTNTIDMYGAANGVNSSAAINEAIAIHEGYLNASSSGYILDAQLNFISGTCTGLKGKGEIDTVFNKAFSGDIIINNNQGATFSDFWIVGDSATYTGGGMYMVSDDSHIERVRITDTDDSTIIFKAQDSTYNTVTDCFLLAANNAYAIRGDGADLSPAPTVRVFTRLKGGGPLVNFAGMNRAILTDSFGTLIGFDANSSKIGLHNNRLTNASSDISVLGLDHNFTGNQLGFGAGFNIKFDATCEAVSFDDSNPISIAGGTNNTCVDNKAIGAVSNTNTIYQPLVDYPFILGGETSNATNGNSSVSARYSRNGRTVNCNFSFVRGSTATEATGNWSLHLPFNSLDVAVGSARIKSSDGTWYDLTIRVFGGSNKAFISFPPAGNMDQTTIPFGLNAQIEASISYILG